MPGPPSLSVPMEQQYACCGATPSQPVVEHFFAGDRSLRFEGPLRTYMMQALQQLEKQQRTSLQSLSIMMDLLKKSEVQAEMTDKVAGADAPEPEARIFGSVSPVSEARPQPQAVTPPVASEEEVSNMSFDMDNVEKQEEEEKKMVAAGNMRPVHSRTSRLLQDLHAPQHKIMAEGRGVAAVLSYYSRRLLAIPSFEYTMGFIIFVNSISVGVETQLSIQQDSYMFIWPEQIDLVFLSIYVFELLVRIFAYGWKACLKDGWFLFDFFLVSCSLAGNVVIPMVTWIAGVTAESGVLASVLVIRSFRLLRLIRALRMLRYFRTVWRLVNGLLSSGNTMLSTCGLLLLTLYMFSCLGVELITKNDVLQQHETTAEIVQRDFGSVQATLLTLLQFVTVDSVAAIYVPLITLQPWLLVYFLPIIVMVSIALMNLVTAVVVEGALDNAQADRELERHDLHQALIKALPRLREIFNEMDQNGDGQVSAEEIAQVPLDVLPSELFDSNSVHSMMEVFEMLDVDGQGSLSQDEFVDGLLELFVTDVPVQTVQTIKLLRLNETHIKYVQAEVAALKEGLNSMANVLNRMRQESYIRRTELC
eukprot:TRINITY_DN14729_c1_g1_i1.p1 TRINITY_DN14729_c1_g1~~TRINITY_DN14729_c1_g1_i1.p1  ORF type:complete len:591 (+),score=127.83 TRINITY_DN14729_c1_g1_i1:167-1939(+)